MGGSGSSPFPKEPFSGLVLVELTLVKAVVVVVVVASDMVGSGRPITPTTAAAIPPLPPPAPAAHRPATTHKGLHSTVYTYIKQQIPYIVHLFLIPNHKHKILKIKLKKLFNVNDGNSIFYHQIMMVLKNVIVENVYYKFVKT